MLEGLVHVVEGLLGWVLGVVHWTIDQWGYGGIALLMAIESANVPLPSEMILPYAGFLVQQGQLNVHGAALAGAVGCVLGSVPSYALGWWGGRQFLNRYGKWLLLSNHDLDTAQQWSDRFGDWAYFICRLLPVVRTFISLPAGILRARFWPFVALTFLGSWIWSYGLVYVGIKLGDNLTLFKHYWHQFDALIAVVILALGVWYVWHHWQNFREDKPHNGSV
jgi:membrane protein DedA with SNARE-associated domain